MPWPPTYFYCYRSIRYEIGGTKASAHGSASHRSTRRPAGNLTLSRKGGRGSIGYQIVTRSVGARYILSPGLTLNAS